MTTEKNSNNQSATPPPLPNQTESRKERKLNKRKRQARTERIACTACGAAIDILNADLAEMISCQHCGAVLELESDNYKVLRKLLLGKRPPTPLPLGSKGKLKGKMWKVIGRVRLYDAGDYWEEYLLFNPVAGYIWLQLEKGHWTLLNKAKKKPRISPANANRGRVFSFLGKKFKTLENSTSEIKYIEGEFPYQAQVGDKSFYLDAVSPPDMVCAQWTEKELEWYTGNYLFPDTVKQTFNLKSVPKPQGVGACQPFVQSPRRKSLAKALLVFAAINFILIFLSLFAGKKSTGFHVTAADYLLKKNPNGFVSQPIKVTKSNIMQIKTSAAVNNSWIFLELQILDEQYNTVLAFTNNISYYHGYEGGESWSEGSGSDNKTFLLEKPGTYYLAVAGEGGRGNFSNIPQGEAVNIEVYQGVLLQRYFILFAILGFVFPIYEALRKSSLETSRWQEDD